MATKIYKYGATHQPKHPAKAISNIDVISEQIYKAHRYKNTLIEIERSRRAARQARLIELSPEYAQAEADHAKANELIESLYDQLNAKRAKARSRVDDPDLKRQIKAAKTRASELNKLKNSLRLALYEARQPDYQQLKAQLAEAMKGLKPADRRKVLAEDERLIAIREQLEHAEAIYEDIEADHKAKARAARAASGLYWGTYQVVEESHKRIVATSKDEPRFRRFDGSGSVAVHLQNEEVLTVAELCEGRSNSLQLIGGNTKGYKQLKLRIGSEGRNPIWAVIPIKLHRPLPDDAVISWCKLHRKKVATRTIYEVHFTVTTEENKPHAEAGTVGIDVGYRRLDDGLRVAVWRGSDGGKGELFIPNEILGSWQKARDLQSIRDKHFDTEKIYLAAYLKTDKVPDWLIEKLQHIAKWRSQAKLASVILHWRSERFTGDDLVYARLEQWRHHDKHLYLWQRHAERYAEAWRENTYRQFAAELRQCYRFANIEKLDLRKLQTGPLPEQEDKDGALIYYRKHAALSILIGSLKQGGPMVSQLSAVDTTRRCHLCGHVNDWADQSQQILCCEGCGEHWDQDVNAAENLLKAEGELLPV